jgi:hypothetical protein
MTKMTKMTKAQFINQLGVGTEFNSNNAWGFGGESGYRYNRNGCTITIAKTSHRHTKGVSFVRVDAPAKGNYSGYGFIDQHASGADYGKILEIIDNIQTNPDYIAYVERYSGV